MLHKYIRVLRSVGMKWCGLASIGELKNSCRIFYGNSEGKRHYESFRRVFEYNIKTDLREMRREVVKLVHMTQDSD
jgi:hypothetical protein